MKRFLYLVLPVLILVTLACAMPGVSTPEPTATVAPSDTPAPTATALPTDTPTSVPTATPDKAATAAAISTKAASDVMGELDTLLGKTDIPYKEGHLVWQQDKSLSINLKGPDAAYLPIAEDISAGNFIIKSDVTWRATGIVVCGAIFRSEPDLKNGKQYQFIYLRLSGLPVWTIEVHEFGRFKNTPTNTKTSSALNLDNGAKNQFVLVVQDDSFTVYLNGTRQGRYYDYSKQRTEGYFGWYGLQDSGDGLCEYNNSWIWSLDK